MENIRSFFQGCPKIYRTALIALFVIGAALRYGPLLRPLAMIDGLTTLDDTYLALEIARNIGQGNGPIHGPGPTNGFQPLYVFMAAPIYAFLPSGTLSVETLDAAVKLAIAMVATVDLLSAVLLLVILKKLCGWGAATITGPAIWLLHPGLIATALNGLETSLGLFFLLFTWLCWLWMMEDRSCWRRPLLLGIALGFGCLARIDLFILGFATGVFVLIDSLRIHRQFPALARDYLLIFGGFLAVYTVWPIYSYIHTGLLFPVSGRAVRFIAHSNNNFVVDFTFFRWLAGLAAMRVWENSPVLLIAGFLLPAASLIINRAAPYRFLQFGLPLLFCLLILPAYIFYVQGYWFFDRYLIPLTAGFLVLTVWGLNRIESVIEGHRHAGLFVFAPVVLALAMVGQPRFWLPFTAGDNPIRGYRNIGIFVRNFTEQGSVIGAPQTGAIAYYRKDFEVINLDGVVNQEAFRALREGRILAYAEEQKIEMVFGWPADIEFLQKHTRDFREDRWQFQGRIPNLASWGMPWLVYSLNKTSRPGSEDSK